MERGRWLLTRDPYPVRLVARESTASLVHRMARAGGVSADFVLQELGVCAVRGGKAVDPRFAEVYLSRAALGRLAEVTGRPVEWLQRVLPSTADDRLLRGARAVWDWPFATAGSIVRACPLCAGSRWAPADSTWLMTVDPWQLCVRHRRWTDATRDDAPRAFDLRGLPEVVDAHRHRARWERRYGVHGAALVADGFAIAGWWWRQAPQARRWLRREVLLGVGLGSVRTAWAVVYPEAVSVTGALLDFERSRVPGRDGEGAGGAEKMLLRRLKSLAGQVGQGSRRWALPVDEWLARHHRTLEPAEGPRGGAPVQALVHREDRAGTSVEEQTCLPWQWTDLSSRV